MEAEILKSAAASLKAAFPAMFSHSPSCKRPHLNVDNLRDALFQAKVCGPSFNRLS